MSEPVKCFFVEPTNETRVYLRRYASGDANDCPGRSSYHNAQAFAEIRQAKLYPAPSFPGRFYQEVPSVEDFKNDDRWPTHCECGYEFKSEDERQITTDRIYISQNCEGVFSLNDSIPGQMWDAWWYGDHWKGTDGRSLVVTCPDGHDWIIDSMCSNCTRRDEDHDCWCRHGEPPIITVDKTPEPGRTTCNAGAGSIQTYKSVNKQLVPSWHGFLTSGILSEQR